MANLIGFTLYCHNTPATEREATLTDLEARHILSWSTCQEKKKTDSFQALSSLCVRWKELFDNRIIEIKGTAEDLKNRGQIIELFQSGRRKYTVKGIVLSKPAATAKKHIEDSTHYLFILERNQPNMVADFIRLLRNLKLNRREVEIVKLILTDRSNKEIAHDLGLSLHTVKGYLKLLMRKLGVSSRTGIIAGFLTGMDLYL